jgi:hypothetical protein
MFPNPLVIPHREGGKAAKLAVPIRRERSVQ